MIDLAVYLVQRANLGVVLGTCNNRDYWPLGLQYVFQVHQFLLEQEASIRWQVSCDVDCRHVWLPRSEGVVDEHVGQPRELEGKRIFACTARLFAREPSRVRQIDTADTPFL